MNSFHWEDAVDQEMQWKTEEYHQHDMHVLAQPRAVENPELPGHGAQWDFTVKVTSHGQDHAANEAETVRSDPDVFYSTQAIAENMGFLKGREIIDGRVKARGSAAGHGGQTL